MSVEVERESTAAKVVATGCVLAIAYSVELINKVGKQTHDSAEIARWGIPGDKHYGETRLSRGQIVPNNRTITVAGVEGEREACAQLGIPLIPAGGLGENLLTEGLGNLSELAEGDEIHVLSGENEPKVILLVHKQNDPCVSTLLYHKQMAKALMGKRGVLCTVLKEGTVQVGDKVAWVRGG